MHNCLHIQWSDVDGSLLRPEDFVIINISGMKYETLKSTLERFPKTLLGNQKARQEYYLESKKVLYFDRCRSSFEAILYYYQSGGILTRPPNIPMSVFEKEVLFFKLGKDVLLDLRVEEGFAVDKKSANNNEEDFQPNSSLICKVWELFEHPNSSMAAKLVSIFSMVVIGISITVFCLETLPVFKNQTQKQEQKKELAKLNQTIINDEDEENKDLQRSKIQPWYSLEMACIIWFTLEYITRFVSSPSKWKFIRSFLNAVDLIAIVPYFVALVMNNGGDATPLSVLRVVRLVRVFRVFKLSRYSMSLQILGNTLRASLKELAMLMFFLFLGVVVYSSALYYAEKDYSNRFKSIPHVFWYSLVTMTTVGYGDIVPSTRLGKLIGSFCAITGVLTLSLPVPVIVSNFEFFYKRVRLQNAEKKKNQQATNGGNC